MKIIERDYLKTLTRVIGTPDIKVITGVRRSGKSTLLTNLKEHIAKEITNANIIHIDFNNIQFEGLQEYHKLNDYIESHYISNAQNFLLIDEVQMCQGFEKAINSLHNSQKYDIFITGSNAFLLGNDLATLFAGRVFPVEIFPFSFKEFLSYEHSKMDQYKMFDRYVINGGFAGSYIYNDLPEKRRYISEIYDTLIIRDIEQKYGSQNPTLLQKIGDFLLDNISRTTTGRSITNILNSEGAETNNKTVGSYLSYFTNAYAFYKIKRYDVEGKEYLRSQDKYYLVDHTIRTSKLGAKNINTGNIYENIVAIELLRRGYNVYVGTLRGKEIDFVAEKDSEKLYFQVSYDITSEETFNRETTSLLSIKDAYPKYLIAHTHEPEWTFEGIKIIDIADWLTQE